MFILIAFLLFMTALLLSVQTKAQSTTSGDVQQSWGVLIANNIAKADSGVLVTRRVFDSLMATMTRVDTVFTPTLNSGSRFSTTKDYAVNISVNVSVTSTLVGTNTGTVSLQKSVDNATWVTISQSSLSISGIVSTQANTQTVSGFLKAGYYYRILTAQTGVNGAVFTAQQSQANSL